MTQIEIVQMLSVRWSCTNTSELPSASPEQKLHQNAKLPNTTARVLGFGWEGIGSPGRQTKVRPFEGGAGLIPAPIERLGGLVPKTCWIADVKSDCGLTARTAPNRM
jgi:hypothetical protein